MVLNPIKLPLAAAWPSRTAAAQLSARQRLIRAASLGVAALLGLLILSAWAIPPLLDWNRFRTAIAAIAGAELGRKVEIGGDVTLRLLPQAILTASDVTLPDRGDGMSARIGALRLEVEIFPLLAGRIVLRDLVLGGPVLTLPWPLPDSVANPVRPKLPHPFAAHVENGTLRIGQTIFSGIAAAIHGGPAPAAVLAPDAAPVAAFGAEGFAAFDGQTWRFTTALGAPDADGVSAVDLALQGQGPARDTGGAIQGTLADGVVQGRLKAGGPDLSLLMPAAAQAWHTEAPFTASGEQIATSELGLSLGGAPATGTFALRLAAPVRLDATLKAASLDLDGWARVLNGKLASFAPPAIPMRLGVTADSANLLGGRLSAVTGALLFDGTHASLDHVQATLPGNARLDFSGRITRAPGGALTVEGPADLGAPQLHTTLAWLRSLDPALIDALPQAVLNQATLTGTAKLTPGKIAITGLAGGLDGVRIAGGLGLESGPTPKFSADITLARLSVDDWLAGSAWHPGMSLSAFAGSFTSAETILHLRTPVASWGGHNFIDVVLDASTGAPGLRLDHIAAAIGGITLSGSGTVAPDGTLAHVRADAASTNAAQMLAQLPTQWRWAPGLWQGQANVELTADGPPSAVALQLRADAGDLTLEADSRRDTVAGTATTTLTLRHPGAPRLLAALGLPGAEHFLDTGSLALLAHLQSAPGHVVVQDFSLAAADLQLSGHGMVDFSSATPVVTGDIRADTLALPNLSTWPALPPGPAWLATVWDGRIGVKATHVNIAGAQVAQNLAATLLAGGGDLLIDDVTAELGGGRLQAKLAIDPTHEPYRAALQAGLTGATIAARVSGLPIDISSGSFDAALDLQASGTTQAALLANLSGLAHATLHNATLSGVDLAQLNTLLTARPRAPRAALQAALSTGSSAGLSGAASAQIDHGRATFTDSTLLSPDGAITATGKLDIPATALDVTFALTPVSPAPPHLTITLRGTGHDAKATSDLGRPGATPKKPKKPAARHASQGH